jgi:hypothetical protein
MSDGGYADSKQTETSLHNSSVLQKSPRATLCVPSQGFCPSSPAEISIFFQEASGSLKVNCVRARRGETEGRKKKDKAIPIRLI